MKSNVLIFSIALNGHQFLYQNNLKSHQEYANKHGFTYISIKRPLITTLGRECAWLKIGLIIRALECGFDWILFLDADTKVHEICPNFITVDKNNKYIYAVNGFSGRINSGVLIIKRHDKVLSFFNTVLSNIDCKIPTEDNVGWGENGHLIFYLKSFSYFQHLDKKWNNNTSPTLKSYITHYSAGPMRQYFEPKSYQVILFYIYQVITGICMFFTNNIFLSKKANKASQLIQAVVHRYPIFTHKGQLD